MDRKASANNCFVGATSSSTHVTTSHESSQSVYSNGGSPHSQALGQNGSTRRGSSLAKDAQVEASFSTNAVGAPTNTGATPRKAPLRYSKHASMPNLDLSKRGSMRQLPRRLNQLNQCRDRDRLIRGPSRTSVQYLQQQAPQQRHMGNNCSEDDEEEDSNSRGFYALDQSQTEKSINKFAGPQVYVENGRRFYGTIDRRAGLSPFTTFVSRDGPTTSQAKDGNNNSNSTTPVSCGFCSSTNHVWTLQCSFCGCHRMSTAPRLKYIMDMIISVEPLIKAEDFSKKILEYAKFDRVALKAEQKFKQASLLRAKTAIIMMNRTIAALRKQMMRMIFNAWKRYKHLNCQRDMLLLKVLSIKERQSKLKRKQISFFCWRGYTERIREERNQRLSIAMRHSEFHILQRCMQSWQRYMRVAEGERKEKQELETEPNSSNQGNELDRLREGLRASRELAVSAMETLLEILKRSQHDLVPKLIQTYELKQMFPWTINPFVESVQTKELIESFKRAEPIDPESIGLTSETLEELFQQAKVKLDQVQSYDTVLQWINYQRVRNAEMSSAAASGPAGGLRTRSSSIAKGLPGMIPRPSSPASTNTKKKEVREIKDLQDLRNSISSPGVMLKLVCHISREAQMEYERMRISDKQPKGEYRDHPQDDVGSPNSGVNSPMPLSSAGYSSGSSQMQLRWLFKLISRVLRLPEDFLSRDAFLLNDFDALYEFLVYLFSFFPNWTMLTPNDAQWMLTNDTGLPTVDQVGSVAASMAYSCQYPFGFERLTLQWHKAHQKLIENHFDAFSQQQFVNLLNKAKQMQHTQQFLEKDIEMVNQLARLHQQRALRDALNDLSRRVLGKDSKICMELEKETWASFVHLNAQKVLPLCAVGDIMGSSVVPATGPNSAMEQFNRIEQVFKTHVLDLMKIFQVFGKDSGAGLSEQEFLKVMTKAGVTDKKNILRSHLQSIYQQSRHGTGNFAGPGGSASASGSSSTTGSSGTGGDAESGGAGGGDANTPSSGVPANDERGASPNEFFEALTRVAYYNLLKRKENLLTPTLASISDPGSESPAGDDDTSADPGTPTETSRDWSSPQDSVGELPSLPSGAAAAGADMLVASARSSVSSVSFGANAGASYVANGTTATANGSSAYTTFGASNSGPTDLVGFVRELVTEKIVPLTRRFQEQGLTFKKLMIHPEVQHVLKNQEKKLRKIFATCSNKHSNPTSRGKAIEVTEFESLLKDKHFVDAFFPYGKIKQLVCFVQQDGDVNSSMMNGESKNEFDYNEFVEALSAIAVYRNANPYVPLAKKLDMFFDQSL